MGQEASEKALSLAEQLRTRGLWVEINYDNASLKSQMRKANRTGAKNIFVIGEDELKNKKGILKNMTDKSEMNVNLVFDEFLNAIRKEK
jgi:histidyl-tRNA synthetase